MALLFSAVGIYGLIGYLIETQRAELGMRAALGATPGDLVRLYLRRGVALAVMGVVIGSALGLALSRVSSSLLFAVEWNDPVTYVLALSGTLVYLVSVTFLSAIRLSKLQPAAILRQR